MTSGYSLDTNAISILAPPPAGQNALRSHVARFRTWVREHDDQLFLSQTTLAEIQAGISQLERKGSARRAAPLLPIGLALFWSFTIPERCRLRRPPPSKLVGCSIARLPRGPTPVLKTLQSLQPQPFTILPLSRRTPGISNLSACRSSRLSTNGLDGIAVLLEQSVFAAVSAIRIDTLKCCAPSSSIAMLDTNICIHVMKNYPVDLREKFNALAEQLCMSSITLGELHYGAEKSARRAENLTAIEHFVARLDVLPFGDKAAAHCGQVRAELERAGTTCGPHDMQIGGHARSEGLIVVTNNMREFARMPGVRVENWV